MENSTDACTRSASCPIHFHTEDPTFLARDLRKRSQALLLAQQNICCAGQRSTTTPYVSNGVVGAELTRVATPDYDPEDHGFRRIIRNFTPSWFIITMSTGVTSIMVHQIPEPYSAHWQDIISIIFFVLNLVLFLTFSLISFLRYTMYPEIFPAVLSHPHQSLFVATWPVGLATLINMTVLVCVPAWGKGMAILAWVLWWVDSVLALTTCFHFTFMVMSHHRSDLEEMTALYLIPIVAVVIAATSGGLVASALPGQQNQLWTLIISYIFWGLGSCLSWIILTLYFLRMTLHKPLKREVIVSLLLPIGPLGLSGFSIITLGKLAKHLFPLVHAVPHLPPALAGDIFYGVGVLVGLALWGFALVWFVVAVIMIVVSGGFPFNMGWWGFIFPVGVFTLLTMSLGEELESRFFKILSIVLMIMCIMAWFFIAARTVHLSITGKMFFAPCLGTDLFLRKLKDDKVASRGLKDAA